MRCYTSAVPLGRRPAVHARTRVAVATSSLVQRGTCGVIRPLCLWEGAPRFLTVVGSFIVYWSEG